MRLSPNKNDRRIAITLTKTKIYERHTPPSNFPIRLSSIGVAHTEHNFGTGRRESLCYPQGRDIDRIGTLFSDHRPGHDRRRIYYFEAAQMSDTPNKRVERTATSASVRTCLIYEHSQRQLEHAVRGRRSPVSLAMLIVISIT